MTQRPAESRTRDVVERVQALLPGRQLRDVRMFGATAVMVDASMAVAVHSDGSLLVRVDPAEDERLLECRDASRAVMGKAGSMGVGWIRVDARALADDRALDSWLEAAARCWTQRQRGRDSAARAGGRADHGAAATCSPPDSQAPPA